MAFEDRTLGNLFDNTTPCGGRPSNRDNDEVRIRIPYFANLNFKMAYFENRLWPVLTCLWFGLCFELSTRFMGDDSVSGR